MANDSFLGQIKSMWILAVFGLLLTALLIWLLVAPMQLEINTDKQLYEFRWISIGKAGIKPLPEDIGFYWQLFFYKKEYSLIELVNRSKSKKEAKTELSEKRPKKKKSKRWIKRRWMRKGKAVIQSFRVREFHLNLDTDDYLLNSYLIPVFFFFDMSGQNCKINYKGESELSLFIENNPLRILKAIVL